MTPRLNGIDHVHVYVARRAEAERWYRETLGLERVAALEAWASADGPLTLADAAGTVHLALFERPDAEPSSTVAFACDADGFVAWKAHLERLGIGLRLADHELAYSMYFSDPDGNLYEITTPQRDAVAAAMAGR